MAAGGMSTKKDLSLKSEPGLVIVLDIIPHLKVVKLLRSLRHKDMMLLKHII